MPRLSAGPVFRRRLRTAHWRRSGHGGGRRHLGIERRGRTGCAGCGRIGCRRCCLYRHWRARRASLDGRWLRSIGIGRYRRITGGCGGNRRCRRSSSVGTGSIAAESAEVAGTGTIAAGNSGELVAQAATITGLGVSESTGTGALQAGAAVIAGAGLVASAGTGDLVAGPATVAGEGVVIEEGVAVGTGALVAGAAAVSGEGEVTGEVAPPVSVGGGRYYPFRQDRPLPVEGIGYAILPQLEGEAHGLVGVAGTGAASQPRGLVGAGAGAVGVVGRSAARFAINAAAVGDRGLAGSGAGTIVGIKAAAIGRHDDDEAAAVMALLLAA